MMDSYGSRGKAKGGKRIVAQQQSLTVSGWHEGNYASQNRARRHAPMPALPVAAKAGGPPAPAATAGPLAPDKAISGYVAGACGLLLSVIKLQIKLLLTLLCNNNHYRVIIFLSRMQTESDLPSSLFI